MRFYIETLGCKVNQYESRAVAELLTQRGHSEAARGEPCDAVIVNTCAVTETASRRSRQAARRLKRLFPGAVLAVCGCAGEIEPEAARALGADIVAGSGARREFAESLESFVLGRGLIQNAPAPAAREFELLPVGGTARARAALKIQDGCDCFCAYCVIPYARGRSRSIAEDEAVARATILARQGFREIVITGIEICSYGLDLGGGETLPGLLRAVSQAAPGARIRLGSLEPSRVTADFVRALSGLPICDHFHMSLQSGSAATLRRMRRKYAPEDFFAAVTHLRTAFPNAGVTADVIAGFPGETEAEFLETLAFLQKCEFSDLHVFPYSIRPGTAAAAMENQLPNAEKKARAEALRAAGARTRAGFIEKQLGKTLEVLFEREKGGFSTGHSGNYLEIREKIAGARGKLLPVVIAEGNIIQTPG